MSSPVVSHPSALIYTKDCIFPPPWYRSPCPTVLPPWATGPLTSPWPSATQAARPMQHLTAIGVGVVQVAADSRRRNLRKAVLCTASRRLNGCEGVICCKTVWGVCIA